MKRGIWGLLGLLFVVHQSIYSEVGTITIDGVSYTGDIKKVPVTFYDFHSDRSNPEFEQPFDSKDHFIKNMVSETLDADGKPTLGSNPFRNNYIKYWFRKYDSSKGAKGDSTIPNYIYDDFKDNVIIDSTPNFKWVSSTPGTYTQAITNLKTFNGKSATWPYQKHYYNYTIPGGTSGEFDFFLEWYADVKMNGTTKLDHDTSFINKMFNDTLLFIDTAYNTASRGKYFYVNDNFYPLDNKGFGNEWNVHDAQYIQKGNEWSVPVSYLTQADGDYNNVNNGYNNLSFKKVTVDDKIYFIDLDYGDTLGLQLSVSSLDHNYGFTMEMNYKFTMDDGLKFTFSGDDDLWVYINGRLVLDLGGIHSPATDSFDVDKLNDSLNLGLVNGEKYSLQAFYAERHSDSSHILITTNIIPVPGEVKINLNPENAHIKAGVDELIASLSITDQDGTPINNDNITSVTWDWDNSTPNNSFFSKIGDSGKEDTLKFTKPHDAYDTIVVKVSVLYIDPDAGSEIPTPVEDEVTIVVVPGPPADIYIEATPDMPTDLTELRDPQELDEVYIMSGQTENSDFYAIERDKYGNWIGPSTGMNDANWDSNKNFLDAQAGDASKGQGKAVLLDFANGQTAIVTASNKGFKDSINVIITGIKFTLETATYYDNDPSNPDGYIDLVVVTLDSLTLALMADSSVSTETVMNGIKQYIELTSDKKLTFTTDDFTAISNGFEISVEQDKSKLPDTDVNETDKLIQNEQTEISGFATMFEDTLNVIDKVAPVIIKVIYDPNDDYYDGDKQTLLIIFSEDIQKPTDGEMSQELEFYDKANNTTYTMVLKEMDEPEKKNPDFGDQFYYEVISINGKENPEDIDEVYIIGDGKITDINDNTQGKETGHININVNPYEISVETKVLGPLTPGEEIDHFKEMVEFLNIDDENVGSKIKNEGTLLIFEIDGIITDSDKDDYEPGFVIFDNVGNVVKDGIEGVIQKDSKGKWNMVASWDGKNDKGRSVGSGSYLGKVVLKKNGITVEGSGEKIIIGVKGVTK